MAKNFEQPGMVVDLPAPAALSSGDGVIVGSLFGVALNDMAISEVGAVGVEGVYELPLDAATAVAVGAPVDFLTAGKKIVATTLGDLHAGHAVEAKGAAAGQTIKVKLGRATA